MTKQKKPKPHENTLVVFQSKKIRRTWHNDEWWFSIADIVFALTDSSDPKQYIKKMRTRDKPLNNNWGKICTPLELIAPDGKKRKTYSGEWIEKRVRGITIRDELTDEWKKRNVKELSETKKKKQLR